MSPLKQSREIDICISAWQLKKSKLGEMNSLAKDHTVSGRTGFWKTQCSVSKVVLLSTKLKLETVSMNLPRKGLLRLEDGRETRGEKPCLGVALYEPELEVALGSACGSSSRSPLSLPLGVPWGVPYFSLTFLEYFMIHSWMVNFLTLFLWNFFLSCRPAWKLTELTKRKKQRDTLWCFISCSPRKRDSLEPSSFLACSGGHQEQGTLFFQTGDLVKSIDRGRSSGFAAVSPRIFAFQLHKSRVPDLVWFTNVNSRWTKFFRVNDTHAIT